MTANTALAAQLVTEANEAASRRRALLCASTALGTTASVPAAREVLSQWDGPAAVRDDAIGILDALTSSLPG
ncbi:MAG: hypothetical protein ACLQDY_08310 [Streptosporangiaceae bacterium]